MMKYEVKKLGVGGVLDQAIAVLRDHFGVLVSTSLVVYLPLALINVIATNFLQPKVPAGPLAPSQVLEFYEAMFTSLLPLVPVWLILAFVVAPLSYGAVVYATSQIYLGGTVTFKSAWKRVFNRKWALMGAWFLYTILLGIGAPLCMIPYIIFSLWFFVFAQVATLERGSSVSSLTRSKSLMAGHYGEAFVLSLMIFGITFSISMFAVVAGNQLVAGIVQILTQSAMMTFGAVVTTVFYYSCRADRDGFDLLWLADVVAAPDEPTSDANQLW